MNSAFPAADSGSSNVKHIWMLSVETILRISVRKLKRRDEWDAKGRAAATTKLDSATLGQASAQLSDA